MNFIGNAIRKRRRREFLLLMLKKLRPMLGHAFGKHEVYTPEQVREAMERADLLTQDLRCGVCLYCSREDYDAWSVTNGAAGYWQTRTELACFFFGGNIGFTPLDVSMAVAALNPSGAEGAGGYDPNQISHISF